MNTQSLESYRLRDFLQGLVNLNARIIAVVPATTSQIGKSTDRLVASYYVFYDIPTSPETR